MIHILKKNQWLDKIWTNPPSGWIYGYGFILVHLNKQFGLSIVYPMMDLESTFNFEHKKALALKCSVMIL